MKRKLFGIILLLAFVIAPLMAGSEITGLWKTVDDNTNEVKSILKIYEYRGKFFGRLLVIFEDGKLKDSYVDPSVKAENVKGEPFFAGLDIIWNLEQKGSKWRKGKIMDPQEGKIYSSELWRDGENLIVRGKIGPFGRNQTWLPATAADLPAGTPEPRESSLKPIIPEEK